MTGRLTGKVAIVTGAGGGIGKAIALRFAAEGANLVVSDFSGAEAQTAAEIGNAALPLRVDVRDRAAVFGMADACIERFGRIDIVSNNAGGGTPHAPVHEITEENWDHAMATNARGYLFVIQSAIPHMIRQGGGAIVNMASATAHRPVPGAGAYVSSKGAIVSLTRAVALEYGAHNIRCNSISPGPIATPMVARQTEEAQARILSRVPMNRIGKPEEVAALALLLASDEVAFLSGQDIIVDGARSAGG